MGEIASRREVLDNEVAETAGEDLVDAVEESQPANSLQVPLHAYTVRT